MKLCTAAFGLACLIGAGSLSNAACAEDAGHASGSATFMQSRCFVCHGQLGYGGAGPGFRGDKMLAVDDFVIGRILLGGGIMPPFAATLSDQQIAAVATYIRTNWGNNFGAVDAAKVAAARKRLMTSAQASSDTHGGQP